MASQFEACINCDNPEGCAMMYKIAAIMIDLAQTEPQIQHATEKIVKEGLTETQRSMGCAFAIDGITENILSQAQGEM
ncbi:MAG: hypothetical protein M3Q36_04565 [bacterium]|nr:hypothetical protein [bacterium]